MQIVVFKIGQIDYALEIAMVQEIVRPSTLTKLPNSPSFMEGVINLRGKIIPVINLTEKFGLTHFNTSDQERLIVLELSEEKHMAIRTEHVSEVLSVTSEQINQPPALSSTEGIHCVEGIIKHGERLIILLNCSNLINADILPEVRAEDYI